MGLLRRCSAVMLLCWPGEVRTKGGVARGAASASGGSSAGGGEACPVVCPAACEGGQRQGGDPGPTLAGSLGPAGRLSFSWPRVLGQELPKKPKAKAKAKAPRRSPVWDVFSLVSCRSLGRFLCRVRSTVQALPRLLTECPWQDSPTPQEDTRTPDQVRDDTARHKAPGLSVKARPSAFARRATKGLNSAAETEAARPKAWSAEREFLDCPLKHC